MEHSDWLRTRFTTKLNQTGTILLTFAQLQIVSSISMEKGWPWADAWLICQTTSRMTFWSWLSIFLLWFFRMHNLSGIYHGACAHKNISTHSEIIILCGGSSTTLQVRLGENTTTCYLCQDHDQLRSLVRSKDRLVQKYSCSTDPARTLCIIPGPGLALRTYHPLSPYLTLDIFPY